VKRGICYRNVRLSVRLSVSLSVSLVEISKYTLHHTIKGCLGFEAKFHNPELKGLPLLSALNRDTHNLNNNLRYFGLSIGTKIGGLE